MISEHHLGQTIVEGSSKTQGIQLLNEPENAEVIKGNGIRATIEGKLLAIGNRKLMASEGVPMDKELEDYAIAREKAGNTAIFASIDGKIAGVLSIADRIRPEANRCAPRTAGKRRQTDDHAHR